MDILLGVLAAIIVAWFSRQREFRADASAAQLMGRKQPMINALARLGGMVPGELPKSVAAMGIAGGIGKLFSTHPPIEERIAALEGAESAVGTSSGMAAILSTCIALLKSGDHIVCSRSVFGTTTVLFTKFMQKFGVTTTFVAPTDYAAWEAAFTPATKIVFVETPSNPLCDVIDIQRLADITHAHSALLVVDNCFCTPALQRPIDFGADVVVHSGTKYLDGQGRVVAGALCATQAMVKEKFLPVMRSAGMSLSPFNAWVVLKGLETLGIRMEAQSQRALELATWLESHPKVARVYYPGLTSHPQHALAMTQQSGKGGAVLSFDVRGETPEAGRKNAFHLIDRTRLMSVTANLGDVKTIITQPASTSHGRLTEVQRAEAGIQQHLVRVAVGLENIEDLKADLSRGLDTL